MGVEVLDYQAMELPRRGAECVGLPGPARSHRQRVFSAACTLTGLVSGRTRSPARAWLFHHPAVWNRYCRLLENYSAYKRIATGWLCCSLFEGDIGQHTKDISHGPAADRYRPRNMKTSYSSSSSLRAASLNSFKFLQSSISVFKIP